MERLADQLAVAVGNARLYQEAKQHAAQLALINDIGAQIAAVLELDSVLHRAADLVQKSFGYHHVALYTADRQRDELVMKAKAGAFTALFAPEHRIGLAQGMVGWVGRHGETLLANDVRLEPHYINLYPDAMPTQSELSVPIRVGDKVVGVLDVQSPLLKAFDGNDLVVMETLANQIAVAIENARLYQDAQRELAERRQAEQALAREQHLLQTFVDNVPDSIYFKDLESRFRQINRALATRFGLSDPAYAIGKTDFDFFSDEHAQRAYADERRVIETGQPVVGLEEKETWPDGRETWVSTTKMPLYGREGQIEGVFGISRDITERKRRAAQLEALRQVGLELGAQLDLDLVYHSIVSRAVELLNGVAGGLYLYRPDRDLIELSVTVGPNVAPRGSTLRRGEGLAGQVWAADRPLPIDDCTRWAGRMAAPIRWGDDFLGVLTLEAAAPGALVPSEVELLGLFATQAAPAIRSVRSLESERKRATLFAVVTQVAHKITSVLTLELLLQEIVDAIQQAFGYDNVLLLLQDKTTGRLLNQAIAGSFADRVPPDYSQAVGEGIMGWTARTGQPQIVNDVSVEPHYIKAFAGDMTRSELCVPLILDDEVIGVLDVEESRLNAFDDTDRDAMMTLGEQITVAIENARLYERTDTRRLFSENIVQSMEGGILLEDTSERIVFTNRRTAELLGYRPEELKGRNSEMITAPEERAKVARETARRPYGYAGQYDTVLLTRQGERVPVMVNATPIFEHGTFAGILALFTDITERKRQESRLRDVFPFVINHLAYYTNPKGLYSSIVEAGAELLSARTCALFLVGGQDSDVLELVATNPGPLGADVPHLAISTRPGCGLAAHVAGTRQPLRLMDDELARHPAWSQELWTRLGWNSDPTAGHSLLAVPICLPEEQLVGVLVTLNAEGAGGFSEFDERLLQMLATHTAVDIGRMRSVVKVREETIRAERKRLEDDLHDTLNVLLTGVQWEAELLSDEIEPGESAPARVALTRLQTALTRTRASLRNMLEDLRDPILEKQGLLVALRKRAEWIGRGRIRVHGDLSERLGPETESLLYRVGLEGMNNAVKHAGFSDDPEVKAELWLERRDHQVMLLVQDNGVGFDVEPTLALSHKWGLRRLRDMLREAGGSLGIESAPGQGTRLCATVDLKAGKGTRSTRS
jgi:PAS domain S-box-containing protein